jgi:hypothetical protein
VPALFPGIEEYAATATRLHPRGGKPDPRGSHIGGPLRWPAGEAWPTCGAEHVLATEVPIPDPLLSRLERLRAADPATRWSGYQEVLAELASRAPGFVGIDRRGGRSARQPAAPYPVAPYPVAPHPVAPYPVAQYLVSRPQPEPSPLVAVAQLRAADVPDLRPPPGTDVLQVLWCPNDHDTGGGGLAPAATVYWRREAEVPGVLCSPPAPASVGHRAYLPRPCVLHPEQVVEYPWWQQLPADLGQRVRSWDADHDGRYHRQLAAAPGWKVGGWPQWPTTDPMPLYCTRCGEPMRQLLQIDSGEWGDAGRWCPLEDRALHPGDGPEHSAGYLAAAEPTGVIAGHTGLYRIFTCPACPGGTDPPHIDLQ